MARDPKYLDKYLANIGKRDALPVPPRCPECGEPARHARVTARVLCELKDDGSAGKIVRGIRVLEPSDFEYECGGMHRWKKDSTTDAT